MDGSLGGVRHRVGEGGGVSAPRRSEAQRRRGREPPRSINSPWVGKEAHSNGSDRHSSALATERGTAETLDFRWSRSLA